MLRGYWDGNDKPSVEAPVGDFFGLNLGQYQIYESAYLACSPGKSLNCYFAMPYRSSARFTVTNEGKQRCRRVLFEYRLSDRSVAARRRALFPCAVSPGHAERRHRRRRRRRSNLDGTTTMSLPKRAAAAT